MNLKLETEFSKADILKEIDALNKQIEDMRPLPEDVEGRVMQKLRLDWNYHSNAIEGNRLNYGETVAFLMEGITSKGKPLKDYLDIRGHNEAIIFLLSIVKEDRPISEADIRALHKMILVEPYDVKARTADGVPTTKRVAVGEYKSTPNHVETSTGELHYYASPEETPARMQELIAWYRAMLADKEIHPLVTAALFHHKFVSIHPFDDGNGRLSRILMNLIVMQAGFPPIIIKMDDRKNYYALLSRADKGDSWSFVEYIAEGLRNSLNLYLKAANGEDIDDDEDIDKEIALFKLEVTNNINVKQQRSNVLINNILSVDLTPLIVKLDNKIKKFSDLFFGYLHSVYFQTSYSEFAKYDSIDQFYSTTGKVQESIIEGLDTIGLTFLFEKFKNTENDFSLEIWITIVFTEYYYTVMSFKDDLIVKKLYHERLSNHEQNEIIKKMVNDFKAEIIQKQKSPKS